MKRKGFLCTLLFAVAVQVAPAFADGYVQFSNTGLNCVVSSAGNYLTTYYSDGSHQDRTVAQGTREANKNLSKLRKALSKLRNLKRNARGAKLQKIKKLLADGRAFVSLIRTLKSFMTACGSGVLNTQALSFPGAGGGSSGGTKK